MRTHVRGIDSPSIRCSRHRSSSDRSTASSNRFRANEALCRARIIRRIRIETSTSRTGSSSRPRRTRTPATGELNSASQFPAHRTCCAANMRGDAAELPAESLDCSSASIRRRLRCTEACHQTHSGDSVADAHFHSTSLTSWTL